MSTHHRPNHPSRELAGSLADAADDLVSWFAGHGSGLGGLLGWITGRDRDGNSVEHLASWITGRKPR